MRDARSADRLICCWVTCKGLVLVMIGLPGYRQKRETHCQGEGWHLRKSRRMRDNTHMKHNRWPQASCSHMWPPWVWVVVTQYCWPNQSVKYQKPQFAHLHRDFIARISSIISVSVMRETKLTRHHSLLLPSLYHFHLFHMMWGVHEWMDGWCVHVCVCVCV